jgi:hypothetical protein
MSDPDLARRLAELDDSALLAAINGALAARKPLTPEAIQEHEDEAFYRSIYPDASGRGPRLIRTPDEDLT